MSTVRSIRLDDSLWEWLAERSKTDGKTVNGLVGDLLSLARDGRDPVLQNVLQSVVHSPPDARKRVTKCPLEARPVTHPPRLADERYEVQLGPSRPEFGSRLKKR